MRRLDAFPGRAGIIELGDPAGVAAGEPDRVLDSPLAIMAPEQKPARARSGAKEDAGAGALEAAPEMARLHGEADPDDRLIARHHRGQDLRPGCADMLADCEC